MAVKFLHTDNRKLTERFVLEARATARCSHENIIVIHDVNHYQAIPYMVLEFLKGQPLNHLVGDERIAPGRAVQLMVEARTGEFYRNQTKPTGTRLRS